MSEHDVQPAPFPLPVNFTILANSLVDSLLDVDLLENQTLVEFSHSPRLDEDCGIFDPVIGTWGQAKCDSYRGAVCQFRKGTDFSLENVATAEIVT